MNRGVETPRRGFLGRMLGAIAAAGLPLGGAHGCRAGVRARRLDERGQGHASLLVRLPAAQEPAAAAAHPQLPEHVFGRLQDRAGQAGAVGHVLRHRHAVEHRARVQRRDVGEATASASTWSLKDAAGKPHTRNVFNRADERRCASAVMQAISDAADPGARRSAAGARHREPAEDGNEVPALRQRVRRRGAWSSRPRGKGKAAELQKDLQANLLPGVTMVPAMVIAIEKAQAAGIRYNRQ